MAHQGYQTDKYGHISAEDFVERIRDAILAEKVMNMILSMHSISLTLCLWNRRAGNLIVVLEDVGSSSAMLS